MGKPISNPKPIQNPDLDLHKLAAVCLDQKSFSKDTPMFRIPMKNFPPWDRTPKNKLWLAQTHRNNKHTNNKCTNTKYIQQIQTTNTFNNYMQLLNTHIKYI